ncbi:MAG: alpha/beta fold hydrolase [Christensenellales bacterium]
MYYKVIGDLKGEVYLFLHGWGADSSIFGRVISVMPKNISYILIDFWGFGQSGEPSAPLSVYDYAKETIEIVNKLNVKNFSIIGHSFGGRIGIILASNYGKRIDKLVLVDSAGIVPRRSLLYKYKIWKFKKLKKKVDKGVLNKECLDKYGSDDYKVLSSVMKRTFVLVVNEDLLYLAKKIECKTYIIWGKDDTETPLYMAKRLNKSIKNSLLFVIAGAGHFSFLDKFDDFVYILYTSILYS